MTSDDARRDILLVVVSGVVLVVCWLWAVTG